VHIADKEEVERLASFVPEKARLIIERFMPGPVTVVLPKRPIVPDTVTGGLNTVAIRIPENPVARELIRLSGCPICAPSANTSTRPSPTRASHVYDDLNGKIAAIVDGGECRVGVESTVIGFDGERPRLLRAGGTAIEELEAVIGEIEVVKNSKVALCPGMKYKHYSPTAEVSVVMEGEAPLIEKITAEYEKIANTGGRPVVICLSATAKALKSIAVYEVGEGKKEYAHALFDLLRRADEDGYTHVLCEGVDESGLGASVMNRLLKAAGGRVL
jgi:L-threonylcarbamoyladenylate synthase